MGLERDQAQKECTKFLNYVGYRKKNIDAVVCPRCHHTVISSTETGVADYLAVINGYGLAVEVKAGGTRFNFADWRLDQRVWARKWEHKTVGGTAWLWLQLGTNSAGSLKAPYPRQVWLVPRTIFEAVRRILILEAGIKSLPMNARAAATRVATREANLHAESLLYDYRMDWRGNGLWMPHPEHRFLSAYKITH